MKDLQAIAKELNEVMGIEPAIKFVGVKKDALNKKLKEAAGMLRLTDADITDEDRENGDTELDVVNAEILAKMVELEILDEARLPKAKKGKGKGKAKKAKEETAEAPEETTEGKKGKGKTKAKAKKEEATEEAAEGKKGKGKEKAEKKAKKEKKVKRPRMNCICDVIKKLPKKGWDMDDFVKKADEHSQKNGNEANEKQTKHALRVILPVLTEFGIVELNGDKLIPGEE